MLFGVNDWARTAIEKLEKEKSAVSGQKEKVMAPHVLDTLRLFCNQSDEFAQAAAKGGTFAECMKSVAAGVGVSISDLEVYKKAVRFFFKDADIEMQMKIQMKNAPAEKEEAATGIVLNLLDLI